MNTKGRPKLFAWDFHGTLEQGTEVGFVQVLKDVSHYLNYPVEIELEEVRRLYGISIVDYLKHFFPKLTDRELLGLRSKIRKIQSQDHIKKYIKPAPYAYDVLEQIKKAGHKNIVVSTSSQKHIRRFLKVVNLTKSFDAIFGIDRHALDLPFDIAREKAKVIKSYANENQVQVGNIIVIGDRSGDIDAGLLIEAKTYQYINPDFLEVKTRADMTITDLREILGEI